MCYHVKAPKGSVLKDLMTENHPELKWGINANYSGYYHVSGFAHPLLPVLSSDTPNVIRLMEWGLIPFWVKDAVSAKQFQNRTLNAVSETVFEKPSFRGAIMHRRCLIFIEGFYEWRTFNKKKYPYFIHLKNNTITSLGGIGSVWIDKTTGEVKETFSILTVPANPLMEQIHNTKKRMPLILSKENQTIWMDTSLPKDKVRALMQPLDSGEMEAWTVSNRLNRFQREDTNTEDANKLKDYQELPKII